VPAVPVRAIALLALLLGAGCLQAAPEPSPQERAWDWLLDQRGAGGRWEAAFVPHLVEAAVASGKDPEEWPSPVPLADQLAWPAEDAGFMASLRPLRAWALLPDHGGRAHAIADRIIAGHDGRQFGEPALLNDDAYAVLGLADINEDLALAFSWALLDNQSVEGGWSWTPGGTPETDMTGIVLAGLRQGGYNATAARAFLDGTRAPGGGHAMHAGGGANCNSTAWALNGYAALGGEAPADGLAFLASLQRPDGALAYQAGGAANALCTVEAVPLLR
jgi:hypothetical protein